MNPTYKLPSKVAPVKTSTERWLHGESEAQGRYEQARTVLVQGDAVEADYDGDTEF